MTFFTYRRIAIIGTTSTGKSTLASQLSEKFNYNFIDLDALHWEPNWVGAPPEVFRERVEHAIKSARWVVAGNYRIVRDIIWAKADAVIWLDYPLWTIFRQLIVRTSRRWWKNELLWGTNYEKLSKHFKLWSEESLINWLFRTYWRRKREYSQLLALPENQHLKIIHLHSPEETKRWLDSLG